MNDVPETILDVRRHRTHDQIRGAVRYDPQSLLEAEKLVLPIDREDLVAIHVDSDDEVPLIENRLREIGCTKIRVIYDSIDEWKAAGGETEPATLEQPIPGEPGPHSM